MTWARLESTLIPFTCAAPRATPTWLMSLLTSDFYDGIQRTTNMFFFFFFTVESLISKQKAFRSGNLL